MPRVENVRCRSALDKSFFRYLKDKRNVALVTIALALGLLLIAVGSVGDGESVAEEGIEERLAAVCSGVEGVGECEVLVYRSSDGAEVLSVIVVCEGADSVEVRHRLTTLVASFFGIGTNRVVVAPGTAE